MEKNIDPKDILLIKEYIKQNGYTPEQLSTMEKEEILATYTKLTKEFIEAYEDAIQKKLNIGSEDKEPDDDLHIKQDLIKIINDDNSQIYETLDDYVGSYDKEELADVLAIQDKEAKITKIKKMVRVKICEIQEFWLEEIEKNIKNLPEEEQFNLMHYYGNKKNNLKALRRIYTKSKDSKYLQKLQEISDSKINIIKEYMPEKMEENYKIFFNQSEEKKELVNKIYKLSQAEKKEHLMSLSMQDLNKLHSVLEEEIRKEQEEIKKSDRYIRKIKKTLKEIEDDDFIAVCLEASRNLSHEAFRNMIIRLSNLDKYFKYRYITVSSSRKEFENLQIL